MATTTTMYGGASQDDVAQQRKLAQQLMTSGMSVEPVQHWTQGLARVLQAGVGGMNQDAARESDKAMAAHLSQTMQSGKYDIPTLLSNPLGRPFAFNLAQMQAEQNTPYAKAKLEGIQQENKHRSELHPLTVAQMQLQQRATAAQLEQTKSQTPEWRKENAARFGIDPNSEAGRAWIVTGNYTPPGPMDAYLRNLMGQIQAGQGGAPAAAPQGTPTPRVQPQSNDVPAPGDPLLIPTQTAAPTSGPQAQAAPPTTVNTPMGPMTEDQARQLGFGLAMAGKGDAGKMINEQADRDKLAQTARNELDKTQIERLEALQNVRTIRSSFNPRYLEWGTQGRMAWNQLASKAGKLSPEQRADLYQFVTFRADAARYINVAIKNASGATVTEQELRRNLAELPNAGSGVFDGDDPVTFKAKLDRAEDVLMLGLARANYLRAQGFKGDVAAAAKQVPLEAMSRILKDRAAQIGAEIKAANPNIDPTELRMQTEQRVRREMGI